MNNYTNPVTVTGNPASVEASGSGKLLSLSVPFSPIQDLHGYDSPWPAGGGINKLPNNATNETKSSNGVEIKAENGVYTITGTPTADGSIAFDLADAVDLSPSTNKIAFLNNVANTKIYCYFCRSGTNVHYWVMNPVNRVVSGWTGSGNEVVNQIRIAFSTSAGSNLNITVSPMLIVTSETNPTSFSPYSNICPITGRTGVDAFVAPNASMWSKYKLYVDTGAASELMPVGKQITDTWKNTGGTEISFPWDVVHYTSGGDAFLKLHFAAPEVLQFDAPEAIYYFDGTEPAGTYHIPIGSAYGTGWVVGHSIQFTLTAAPDEGDQLFIDCGTNYANDPTDGRTWKVFAKGDTTAKQSGTTSNGTGGTSLGTIGNVNAHRTNGRLNAISRVVYGYARWSQSAMRQYFNSADVNWWTMKNPWDRPPAQASTIRGFLCGFSQDFLDHLEETEVVTALNTQEGFAEATETTLDKIFLPSLEQMYINPLLAGVEGESWDYYKALAEEAGLSGKFQTGQTYSILISYNASNTSSAVYVFLRSCNRGGASHEWLVGTSGNVGTTNAGSASRGCPACKFKKSAPNGTRYNVDWTSAAGTVYGGTLDVVTGVLTVDRALYTWSSGGYLTTTKAFALNKSDVVKITPANQATLIGAICDSLPSGTWADVATQTGVSLAGCVYGNGLAFRIAGFTTAEEYTAFLANNPLTFAYLLATPLTYQLTATQIALILGQNYVWSDSNEAVTLTYVIKLFTRYTFKVNNNDYSQFVERDSYVTELTPVFGETIKTMDGVNHTALLRLRGSITVGLNPQTKANTAAICADILQSPVEVQYHCLQRNANVTALMVADTISAQFLSRCLANGDDWNKIEEITLTEL